MYAFALGPGCQSRRKPGAILMAGGALHTVQAGVGSLAAQMDVKMETLDAIRTRRRTSPIRTSPFRRANPASPDGGYAGPQQVMLPIGVPVECLKIGA